MLPIDLEHIAFALAAAEHGSFRRAADVLRVKQSALSRRIRQLEERIGFDLFDRSSVGVQPTPAGSDFLRNAKHLLDTAGMMFASAREVARGDAGWLVIGFHNTALTGGPLRTAVTEFHKRYPHIGIRVVEDVPKRLVGDLHNRALDIAVFSDPYAGNGYTKKLWSERLFVALPEKHRLSDRELLKCEDIRGERLLISSRHPGNELTNLMMNRLITPGACAKIVSHAVGWHKILALVGLGYGLALVSESGIQMGISGAIYRPISDAPALDFSASWLPTNPNPALKSFLGVLKTFHPQIGDLTNASP